MLLFRRLRRAVTRNQARTHPEERDPRLRGRTYAIPFDRVWDAALELAGETLARWTLIRADDQTGILEAEAKTLVFRFVDDVRIRIGLDENGQTRVDLESQSRKGKADLGTNARRIGRFLKRLDEAVGARPDQVLEPRVQLRWEAEAEEEERL